MEIRVLGCHGSQLPGHGLTGFLIDKETLLDAGAVTSVLTLEEQLGIKQILVTHAHLDHIREIASLADNLCYYRRQDPVKVVSTPQAITMLRRHIFNGAIWPDFSSLPSPEKPVLEFKEIEAGRTLPLGGLRVVAIPVHHSVETVAYVVESGRDDGLKAALFVGDTGPTEEVWQVARAREIGAIFVETSLPGRMDEAAGRMGHLTTLSLEKELRKLGALRADVYLYHMKLPYDSEIRREIEQTGNRLLHVLQDGQVIRI